jgi:hypothetical protein
MAAMRKVNRTMGDQILCAPTELASAGVKFSEKALQVLDIHSNLNGFSQTLHDSLPNENAQISIDKFWTQWSKLLLDMAVEIENIGILLANAAVAYLESDDAIIKAFHGDQAAHDAITGDLNKVKDDKNKFDNKFDEEKKADTAVHDQQTQDEKEKQEAQDQAFNDAVNSEVRP